MWSRFSRRGSAAEFALLLPMLALLIFFFFDLTLAALKQFRLELIGVTVARELGASRAPDVFALQALADDRVRGVDASIIPSITLRVVPSKKVSAPRDARPIEVIDVVLTEPMRRNPFLWLEPLMLTAHTREVRAQ